jgi:hypothetical protein
MRYKIFCFLPGDSAVFPVKISETRTVAELKKRIKKETHRLAAVDAHEVTLYRVDIDASDMKKAIDEAETIFQGLSTSGNVELLNPVDELKGVFKTGFAGRTIHILVQPPRGKSIDLWTRDAVFDATRIQTPPRSLHLPPPLSRPSSTHLHPGFSCPSSTLHPGLAVSSMMK